MATALQDHAVSECDMLIVGGGAAGCALGYLLRNAGLDVLIAELRDADSKEKLCAGLLDPFACNEIETIYGQGALDELGVLSIPTMRSICQGVALERPSDFRVLPRKELDDWLLCRFLESGGRVADRLQLIALDKDAQRAQFRDLRNGTVVQVAYRTLVGADGVTSAVRRILTGRRQRICPALEGVVPMTENAFVMSLAPGKIGYCWYIPRGADATVGCMYHGASALGCRELLSSFCAEMGIEMPSLRGAPIPEGDDIMLRAAEHAWLVGDAAGLILPFYGGGIQYALHSARMLAESLTGGVPYEQSMSRILREISMGSQGLVLGYFFSCLMITKSKDQA